MGTGKVVIALGGNALGGNVEEQRSAVARTAAVLVDIVEQGRELIITHGNGPQVGMIKKAMDALTAAEPEYRDIPLALNVAMSQGYIGIDLQNAVKGELARRGIEKKVSTILSQVEVDPEDPAFQTPTKPIGSFLSREAAAALEARGVACMEDAGRGWRVAVASPMPRRICELETIRTLVDAGHIVITCGGGGIPVVRRGEELVGVSAVIDKDHTSSLLARKIGAEEFVILTAVEKVALHFGEENQTWLSELTAAQARRYAAEGQFARGSMLPKVEAAIRFAESGPGRRALITLLEKAAEGIAGRTGTVITA